MWLQGFLTALSGTNILWLMLGTIFGLIIGVLPALGSTLAVAVMLPFTFGFDPATALIFLTAIHAACNYGDSLTSILLNVPGGPGTVATCWDGYPMAQRGQAGRALGIATLASFLGGALCWLSLVALVKPIEALAFRIGAPEYFALGVMALSLISIASKGETLKGLIMAAFGLLLSTIGQDPVSGVTYRFTFGVLSLEAGIPIVVSTLGIFAISQVIAMLEQGGTIAKTTPVKDSVLAGFLEVLKRPLSVLRSGVIGWFVGILPALGVSLAGVTTYLVEKRASPEGKDFGKGSPAGVLAAEVGKGACVVGDLIPTFLLGVPGSVTGAILMGALIIHGIDPGPRFLLSGDLPYIVFAGLLLGQLAYVLIGPAFCRVFVPIIYTPVSVLAPAITVLVFFGGFVERNYMFDLLLLVFFGLLAYALGKIGYPVVCMVLGLILGPMVEENLGRSLGIEYGSWAVFLHRPIALILLIITALGLAWPYLWPYLKRLTGWFSNGGDAGVTGEGEIIVSKKPNSGLSEFFGVFAIGGLAGIFLWQSGQYEPAVRFFPAIVSGLIIVLTLVRLFTLGLDWVHTHQKQRNESRRSTEAVEQMGISPWIIMLTLLGYVALVYAVGFTLASIIFVPVASCLAGYRKWLSLGVLSLSLTGLIVVFARVLQITLPMGVILRGF